MVFLGILLLASVLRRPYNSTKITFLLFAVFLIAWNLLEITFKNNTQYEVVRIALSQLTLFFLNLSVLHFPFYNRRENMISFIVSFMAGIGYVTLIFIFFTPFVEENYPLNYAFYRNIQFFLSRSFDLMAMVSVLAIAYMKMSNAVPKLRKVLHTGLFVIFISTLGIGVYNFELGNRTDILVSNNLILYLDMVFLALLIVSLFNFKFISFYPGMLSVFVHGEIPELMVQKSAPASQEGATILKEELWKLYEVEHWGKFLSEFWFSIIVDETLGNALLHGGKRAEDSLIFQVFETKKFLDFYVIDMGKGFDPDTLQIQSEDGVSGKGIFILKKLFQVDWNFLGNEIRVRVSKNPEENPKDKVEY